MQQSIVTVVTPAASVGLTTLDRAKAIIGVSGTTADEFLKRGIVHLSKRVADYCHRTLVSEEVRETWRLKRQRDGLRLARYPVSGVASVTECGTALSEAAWESDLSSGQIWRLCNDQRVCWRQGKIEIQYTAGYVPPDDADTDPDSVDPDTLILEAQVIELLKRGYYAIDRDPNLRSETVLSGLYSYSLFDPANAENEFPGDICRALEPYVKRDRG